MTEPLDAPITLDQLEVFLAVVESGSFSRAAKRLRRVQSAVSYSIANLERLLEVELFDRGGRTPVLTEAGRALLADVRAVSDRVDRLHARARSLATGLEPRVSLAVDMLFPMGCLVTSLREFTERYPTVDLHLRTEALGAVTQLVADGICQLGIGIELDAFPRGLTTAPLTAIEIVAVCGAAHRLSTDDGVATADLRNEVQIVVTDRSSLTEGQDRAVISERTWRVADLDTKRALIAGGLGWGMMPMHYVRDALDRRELARISLRDIDETRAVPLLSIYRTADPPGPAAAWLLGRLTT